jgi:hypothetical protein
MSSFPTPITNLKLRISTGSSTDVEIFEESIPPSAISGINGIHVINNPSLIGASGAFNTKPHGTIFNSAIVTTYDDINLVPGEIIITPGNSNFVPNPIQANLSLAPLPELNTLSSSFSLNDYITKNSPAPLSFSSNNTSVITVSSAGLVTIQGVGQATITITQPASSDNVYTAATPVSRVVDVSTPPPPPSGLVARYSFDSNGNDTSTNDNHLTNNNTVMFNTVDYKQGIGAASFNGSNYFQIANNGMFSPDNFTVACWIKPVSSAGDYQSIATCRTGYSPNLSGWMIYIHPDNNLQFWTGNGSYWSGGSENLFSGFGNLNRWVHLAFTFNKATGSLVMYVDGTLTTTVSRSYANTTVNSLRIGAGATEQNAQFFLRNGTLLDDFRFYHGVLSASEISDIYSN